MTHTVSLEIVRYLDWGPNRTDETAAFNLLGDGLRDLPGPRLRRGT